MATQTQGRCSWRGYRGAVGSKWFSDECPFCGRVLHARSRLVLRRMCLAHLKECREAHAVAVNEDLQLGLFDAAGEGS